MKHDEAFPLLDAFVDDELDPVRSCDVARHLEECSTCATFVDQRRALRSRLRAPQMRFRLPGGLIDPSAVGGGRLAASRRRPPAWLIAAAIAAVFSMSGYFFGLYVARGEALSAQFVRSHARSLLGGGSVDVNSSDHHQVKPWFAQKLLFSPPVPEMTGGDRLLGGRAELFNGVRVAAIVYRHGAHLVNVFVWPRSSSLPGTTVADQDGFHVLSAVAGEFDAAFVSDLNRAELAAFRDRWLAESAR